MRPFIVIGVIFFLALNLTARAEYSAATHKDESLMVSTEREVSMGRSAAKEIEKSKEVTICRDPAVLKRMHDIGRKIAAVCDRQEVEYYFYVISIKGSEKEKNAFAVPGGYIYIFKGLYDNLNDDELAFTIAHEVGHINARHHIKHLQAALAANLLTVAAVVAPVDKDQDFVPGSVFAISQLMAGYSREDELQADELAVRYAKDAGFDPQKGISVLEKLHKDSKKSINPYSYYRTHPYTGARIANIRKAMHLPPSIDDYVNEDRS